MNPPPPTSKPTLTSLTDDLRRTTVSIWIIQIQTVMCYHTWFWKTGCVLTLAGLVLSAQRMQLCQHTEICGGLFPHEGSQHCVPEVTTDFFPLYFFLFLERLLGSCSHFFCFPLLSKGFYSENLWMILSVDSICCTFGKVDASCKEILIGYWFRC